MIEVPKEGKIGVDENGKLLNCGIDPETEELFKQPVVLIEEHELTASSASIIETLTLPAGTLGFLDCLPHAFEGYPNKEMICSVRFHFKLGDIKASVSSFVPVASLLKLDRSEVPEEYRLKDYFNGREPGKGDSHANK